MRQLLRRGCNGHASVSEGCQATQICTCSQQRQALKTCAATLQQELDRFVNALISIREEIKDIENGKMDK